MLLLLVLVVPVLLHNQDPLEMEHQGETPSFIPQHILHILPPSLFVELEVVEHQVGQEEMVLLLLVDQVVVEVEKTLMEQTIILLEQ